jgi:hypothetical protein
MAALPAQSDRIPDRVDAFDLLQWDSAQGWDADCSSNGVGWGRA